MFALRVSSVTIWRLEHSKKLQPTLSSIQTWKIRRDLRLNRLLDPWSLSSSSILIPFQAEAALSSLFPLSALLGVLLSCVVPDNDQLNNAVNATISSLWNMEVSPMAFSAIAPFGRQLVSYGMRLSYCSAHLTWLAFDDVLLCLVGQRHASRRLDAAPH